MLSEKILSFYKTLNIPQPLPEGIGVMNPYQDEKAFDLCATFYRKYYGDDNTRRMIIGINPGRFGGGITGVPFTDPIKLEKICGIPNDLQKKPELSADFVYAMIAAFGGPEQFYSQLYFSAVSPLGFTKDGKNINYYDSRELQEAVEPFAIKCIQEQLAFGITSDKAFCLGEGENYKYLSKLNKTHKFFGSIEPLPHPRFIMQYRRKRLEEFIAMYVSKLSNLS